MSILNFSIPSDKKILDDIQNPTSTVKFIGNGSICQNTAETTYIRLVKFDEDDSIKKVTYKKEGITWGFKSVEIVNF